MTNNEEIWKDIEGYEGLYQISDKGRVKSLRFGKEKILKSVIDKKNYLQVVLYKNKIKKHFQVHRLVALAFISNPQNYPQVNHKDENPSNNNLENLEWCTSKYNINYGTRIQRFIEKKSKTVLQFTKSGEFIKKWKSAKDAERNLGYSTGNITSCCRGKAKSAYGYVWRYKK